jgi:hypothetical protein
MAFALLANRSVRGVCPWQGCRPNHYASYPYMAYPYALSQPLLVRQP